MALRNRLGRLTLAAAALAQIACAAPLHRTLQGNYKIDGPDFEIAALPGGRLMPEGWLLKNYEEKDGNFSSTEHHERHDLVLEREGGGGEVRIGPGDDAPCDWIKTPTYCSIAGIHNDIDYTSLHFGAPSYAIRSSRPYSAGSVEGVETVVDKINVLVGVQGGPVRIYQLWFHDRARKHFELLTFIGEPAQFAAMGNDVSGLVKRLSFP